MLGGNNANSALPVFLDERHFQYQTDASNQLQLLGHSGCNVDPVNYLGNEHRTPMPPCSKRHREMEKLQISLNYKGCKDEADRSASIPRPNHLSTGLKLSYDSGERNSAVTSASGSMTAAPSIIMSLDDSIRTELDRQNEDFDQYVKIQEERLMKGVRQLKQRHMASFLASVEKGIGKKLHEKDLELENINRKNKELSDRIKHVAMEAQNWHYRAKYNESVVNLLKTNLQQAISQGLAEQGKEGFGDSEIDDTASYADPSGYLRIQGGTASPRNVHNSMLCKACKVKEVCILLTPCRHLCLCKECDVYVNACPVCQLMKTASYQVFLS